MHVILISFEQSGMELRMFSTAFYVRTDFFLPLPSFTDPACLPLPLPLPLCVYLPLGYTLITYFPTRVRISLSYQLIYRFHL